MQNEKNSVHCDRRNIASAKTENGLTPAIASEELLNAVPQVKKPVRGGYRAAVQLRQYQYVLEAVDPRGGDHSR